MSRKEGEKLIIDNLKSKVLDVLDGKILSTRQISLEMGLIYPSQDSLRVSDAIDSFFRIEKEDNSEFWVSTNLGFAITSGNDWQDCFRYYLIDQEEAHIEAGNLSKDSRIVSGKAYNDEIVKEFLAENRKRRLMGLNLPPKTLTKLTEILHKEE